MKYQGKLINWNDSKGFGFVEPNGGGKRAFVHIKSFQKRSRRPVDGDLIVYTQVQDTSGKVKATNISLVADRRQRKKPSHHPRKLGALITAAFCFLMVILVVTNALHVYVLLLYGSASLLTFVLYWFDKSAAQKDQRRTQESTLHFFALVGGWPGAYYAQNILRHKSSKKAFKRVFWATVVFNLVGFLWLLSELR